MLAQFENRSSSGPYHFEVGWYKPSLNVHIVWHPEFDDGRRIATRLYCLLSHDPDKPLASALGIPIFFLTAPVGAVPPDIVLGRADHTVIILLIDKQML